MERSTSIGVEVAIIKKYISVRAKTKEICAPLKVEDYVPQPAEFASPPKWHLAHTTWFFEEMLLKSNLKGYDEFDASFGFLFNSYYESVGERTIRENRGLITRPSVDEVYAYRDYVDLHMVKLMENFLSEKILEVILLGLNHEQQHQELLLTDLKYSLGQNPIYPVYGQFDLISDKNEEHGWLHVAEGVYEIGHSGSGFSFDNEHGRHNTYIQDTEISKALVTNGEYIEFIEDAGYSRFQFWLDEGWKWVMDEGISAPEYWVKKNDEWYMFTLSGLKKVDHDTILCHISFYEANAFASWKQMRLPTEFEWEVAADKLKWGKRWEWTSSAYLPYPKFKIAPGALGEYNGKFMVNQMVLRGGSVATSEGHSRKTYRNFFHPIFRWQYSGIRLAK